MQRLVLVEDEPDLRRCLTRALHRQMPALEVVPARDADEALALCRSDTDLLVTDIRMPGLRAIEMIAAARSEHPSLKVLVMTAYSNHPPFEPSAPTAYLEKPFDLSTFLGTTKRLLAHAGANSLGLVDIAQLCCLDRFTGRVEAKEAAPARRNGEVWFELGRPIHASTGDQEGAAAFREMASWPRGAFELGVGTTPLTTIPSRGRELVAPGSCCQYLESAMRP